MKLVGWGESSPVFTGTGLINSGGHGWSVIRRKSCQKQCTYTHMDEGRDGRERKMSLAGYVVARQREREGKRSGDSIPFHPTVI